MDTKSEFIDEIALSPDSRFHRTYGGILSSRLVYEDDTFIAFPTIGQLFEGSLLVVPKRPVELMADLPPPLISQAISICDSLSAKIGGSERVLLFEHGARCGTGRNCGVYHAHIHLVPVPKKVATRDLLPDALSWPGALLEAFLHLHGTDHYLLVRDCFGRTATLSEAQASRPEYRSQFFRRWLVEHFALHKPYDWRAYSEPEAELIATVNRLQCATR